MAPFGVLAQQIAGAQEAFRTDLNVYFTDVFKRISDLFAAFGPHWLNEEKPESRDEQVRLLVIAGNVICRQRPGTAKGFVFVSLEDETVQGHGRRVQGRSIHLHRLHGRVPCG